MSEKVIKVVSETLGVHADKITAESHLVDDLGADDFDTCLLYTSDAADE